MVCIFSSLAAYSAASMSSSPFIILAFVFSRPVFTIAYIFYRQVSAAPRLAFIFASVSSWQASSSSWIAFISNRRFCDQRVCKLKFLYCPPCVYSPNLKESYIIPFWIIASRFQFHCVMYVMYGHEGHNTSRSSICSILTCFSLALFEYQFSILHFNARTDINL
jgi:hypothetical protein